MLKFCLVMSLMAMVQAIFNSFHSLLLYLLDKLFFPLTLNYERKLRMSKRDRDLQESTMADGDLNEEELFRKFVLV